MLEPIDQIDNLKKMLESKLILISKYEGYIEKQLEQVDQFKKFEKNVFRKKLDYVKVQSLRIEARQKLIKLKPISIGQASRISGVSPADISVLLIYLRTI